MSKFEMIDSFKDGERYIIRRVGDFKPTCVSYDLDAAKFILDCLNTKYRGATYHTVVLDDVSDKIHITFPPN